MGQSNNKQRGSMFGRTGTMASQETSDTRYNRFTTRDSTMFSSRAFSYQGNKTFLELIPPKVVDQISKFLSISDLVNIQCTNSQICELFYNTLPYSIKCGSILYKNYEDGRCIARSAMYVKSAQWIQVYRDYVETRNELNDIDIQLREAVESGFQKHFIYPPVLLDEINREGLNSDFQKNIMLKMEPTNEYYSVTEMQMLNQMRIFIGQNVGNSRILIELRLLKCLVLDNQYPRLLNSVITVIRAIQVVLQIIAVTLQSGENSEDGIGLMGFYLYNWQMYAIWMQAMDVEFSRYLQLIDVMLREVHPKYEFPQFTINWIMMTMWNRTIQSHFQNRLKHIFIMQINRLRITNDDPNEKYIKYLLRDYVRYQIDYSTHQGNVKLAGHSKFPMNTELESTINSLKMQTQYLYEQQSMDYIRDIKLLKYVFQQHLFESRILQCVLDSRIIQLQHQLDLIYKSPEFTRRQARLTDERQFLNTPQVYELTWLNKNRVQSRISKIVALQQSNQTEEHEINEEFKLNYVKVELDKMSAYVYSFHRDIYDEIEQLVKTEIEAQDGIIIRDSLISHRNKLIEIQTHLTPYEGYPEIEQFLQVLATARKNKYKSVGKSRSEPAKQQFISLTIQTGLSLAQSLKEQYIQQQ